MKKYYLSLLNIIIAMTILIGMPWIMGSWGWIWISWLPALFAWFSLQEQTYEINGNNT